MNSRRRFASTIFNPARTSVAEATTGPQNYGVPVSTKRGAEVYPRAAAPWGSM